MVSHCRLVMVARIWLERERYEEKQNWPANHFADNWLFTQEYDRRMMPVNNASIMGTSSSFEDLQNGCVL